MKLFLCIASMALSLGIAAAGRPSAGYLPPNYAGIGAAGSSQFPRYHGVSGVGGGGHSGHHGHHAAVASPLPGQAGSHYGHNRAGAQIPILRNQYNNDGNGHYNFGFETGNGIKRDESGHLQGGWPHGSLDVKGSYSYTGDDGKVYSVNYKADSSGFHAEGAHLPTPPPIPREIQETLHLHQHGSVGSPNGSYGAGSHHAGAGHHPSSGHHASAGHHASSGYHGAPSHFAAASHHAPNRAPSSQYLPPQASGHHYGRRH